MPTPLTDLHRRHQALPVVRPAVPAYAHTLEDALRALDTLERHYTRLRRPHARARGERVAAGLMNRAAARLRDAWPRLSDAQHQRLMTYLTRGDVTVSLDWIGQRYDHFAGHWTDLSGPHAPQANLHLWFELWDRFDLYGAPDEPLFPAHLPTLNPQRPDATQAALRDLRQDAEYVQWRQAQLQSVGGRADAQRRMYLTLSGNVARCAPALSGPQVTALITALISETSPEDTELRTFPDDICTLLAVFTPIDQTEYQDLRGTWADLYAEYEDGAL